MHLFAILISFVISFQKEDFLESSLLSKSSPISKNENVNTIIINTTNSENISFSTYETPDSNAGSQISSTFEKNIIATQTNLTGNLIINTQTKFHETPITTPSTQIKSSQTMAHTDITMDIFDDANSTENSNSEKRDFSFAVIPTTMTILALVIFIIFSFLISPSQAQFDDNEVMINSEDESIHSDIEVLNDEETEEMINDQV